ncbi:MAG: hypothetical protein HY459_01925 [Parcubacteria group bacterium]|nr:hypothetical protein [Parcubacteria group bacterium]
MQGVEMSHCNAVVEAVLSAYYSFMASTAEEALKPVLTYGKSDTLGLDATPEINIVEHLQRYDHYAVVITEETGEQNLHLSDSRDPRKYRTIFVSDPTDRSRQIKEVLETIQDRGRQVGEIFRSKELQEQWEQRFGAPASITGASSAITCVRRGVPLFALIVNFVTQQLFLSSSVGNYVLSLPEERQRTKPVTVDYITAHGKKVYFRDLNATDVRRFVTFMGKAGYRENFIDSRLMTEAEMEKLLHYDLPGGPLRVLYLSTLQPEEAQIGFILANGEKIVEWIHWLPFVRFAKKKNDESEPALRLFEIYQDRPWTKDGILMSTPPSYSSFRPFSPEDRRMVIDVGRFSDFPNPSRIRATLIVTPYDNDWATRVVRQYGYRAIELYSEQS